MGEDQLLTSVLCLFFFGAGCVAAMVFAPLLGGAGVMLGSAIGGTIMTIVARAQLAGREPPRSAQVAFLVAFLAIVPFNFAHPITHSLALGYLSGFFAACAAVTLVLKPPRQDARTVVTWNSTHFNSKTPLPHFINPNCFGEDAAAWLIHRLQEAGLKTDANPDQEDFGWYFRFTVANDGYLLIMGYQPGDPERDSGRWVAMIEHGSAWKRVLQKARDRRPAAAAVHEALRAAPEVQDVQWYFKDEFDGVGGTTAGSPTP